MFEEGSPQLHQADDRNFQEEVLAAPGTVLVSISATWCGPCRALGTILERLAREFRERLKVVLVDADRGGELMAAQGVEGVPTFLVLRQGRVVDRITGVQPFQVLRDRIEKNLDGIREHGDSHH